MIATPFLRRICMLSGFGLAVVSLVLTVNFGLQISLTMGIGLGVMSFIASYIWPIIFEVRQADHPWAKVVVSAGIVVAVAITAGDIITNASTAGAHRVSDVQQAKVQTARHDMAGDAVKEGAASLKLWRERLATLEAQNAWLPTVTASALRAEVPAMDKAIELETARGGCKTKCQALMAKKGDLEARIALAEEKADLSKKIEATKAVLDKHRATAMTTERGESAVATQNMKLAGLITLSQAPSEAAQYWVDTWLMVFLGALLTLASQFFNLLSWAGSSSIGGMVRRLTDTEHKGRSAVQPARPHIGVAPVASRTFEPAETVAHTAVPAHEVKRADAGASVRDAIERVIERARVNGGLGGISMPARVA